MPLRLTAATAAAALGLSWLAAAPAAEAASRTVTGSEALSLVNSFIGSQDDGNTYPGATVPFGMVQLSPDTGHNTGYDYTHNVV
ncbi:MAG: hypothetical protein REI45_10225, partial [Propionicimonas sp.]|nr:hypothetical protein [Propionicimonas sp.]